MVEKVCVTRDAAAHKCRYVRGFLAEATSLVSGYALESADFRDRLPLADVFSSWEFLWLPGGLGG